MSNALTKTQKIAKNVVKLFKTYVNTEDILKYSKGNLLKTLEIISKEANFKLKLNKKLKNLIKNENIKKYITEKRVSLKKLLEYILDPLELDYYIEDNKLIINSPKTGTTVILKTYDISELVGIGLEHKFNFYSEQSFDEDNNYKIFGINFKEIIENIEPTSYTESNIAQIIKKNIYPNSWKFPKSLIACTLGKLIVSNFSYVHKEIETFLDELKFLSNISINLDLKFIICKGSFFKQLGFEFTPKYVNNNSKTNIILISNLDAKNNEILKDKVEKSKDAFFISHPSITLFHLELKPLHYIFKTDFLAGYDKNGNEILGRMYEGVLIKVKPNILPSQKKINLLLELDIASINKPVTSIPISDGEIAFPSQLIQSLSFEITIEENKPILIAGFNNPFEDEGDKSFSSKKKEHLILYIKANIKK